MHNVDIVFYTTEATVKNTFRTQLWKGCVWVGGIKIGNNLQKEFRFGQDSVNYRAAQNMFQSRYFSNSGYGHSTS
eukprot:1220891-Amphidinium_carterae.1